MVLKSVNKKIRNKNRAKTVDSAQKIAESEIITYICKSNSKKSMAGFFRRVWLLYYDGFRQMTIGKTLWLIILLKLFIFFVVMKLLFFPDVLERDFDNDRERADHVRHELTRPR